MPFVVRSLMLMTLHYLSPTITSVKLLLKGVGSFGEEYFIKFNPGKTKLVKFGTSNQMTI